MPRLLQGNYKQIVMLHSNSNKITANAHSLIMYVDMNSYFASCEQQLQPHLRDKPVGVCAYVGPNAAVIAPSKEAKLFGVKTGMRASECKMLCPDMVFVPTRAVHYRRFHVQIIEILRSYCDDVIPKSIDEAVMNLSSYIYVYKDIMELAGRIKKDIAERVGEYITCSIGIAANTFYAKLGTELQKPDGLVQITSKNLHGYLAGLKLTDFPGIAKANERRLQLLGIRTPLEMYNASETQLRKAFGGVTGNYWYYRLHFAEVDLYTSGYKTMSAMRSISKQLRASRQSLLALLIALCTRLEQRMVKQGVFCREIYFYTTNYNAAGWKVAISPGQPLQDGMELMRNIMQRAELYETQHGINLFSPDIKAMGVVISRFVSDKEMQYSLFDNTLQKNLLRKTVYQIKDRYGKNSVRKASEIIETKVLKDAIGFGSVKDLYKTEASEGGSFNPYLLEEDEETM